MNTVASVVRWTLAGLLAVLAAAPAGARRPISATARCGAARVAISVSPLIRSKELRSLELSWSFDGARPGDQVALYDYDPVSRRQWDSSRQRNEPVPDVGLGGAAAPPGPSPPPPPPYSSAPAPYDPYWGQGPQGAPAYPYPSNGWGGGPGGGAAVGRPRRRGRPAPGRRPHGRPEVRLARHPRAGAPHPLRAARVHAALPQLLGRVRATAPRHRLHQPDRDPGRGLPPHPADVDVGLSRRDRPAAPRRPLHPGHPRLGLHPGGRAEQLHRSVHRHPGREHPRPAHLRRALHRPARRLLLEQGRAVVGQPRPRAHDAAARRAVGHQGLPGQHQRDRHPGHTKLPRGLRKGQQDPPQARAPAGDGAGRHDGVPGPRARLGVAPRGTVGRGPAAHRGLRQGGRAARLQEAVARRAPVLGRRADARPAQPLRHVHHVAAVPARLRLGAHGGAHAQRQAHRHEPDGLAAPPGAHRQPQRDRLGRGALGRDHEHPRRRLRPVHGRRGGRPVAQPAPRWGGRLQRLQAPGLCVM